MPDPTSLLIDNLIDAFRQLNQYLALGLVAAVSALALERGRVRSARRIRPARRRKTPSYGEEEVSVAGWPPMARENAQLLLVGVSFVAGLMGSFAAEGAANIVGRLQEYPELLDAACTFSSVATAPVGIPILASALPPLAVAVIILRKWWHIRELGLLGMLALFVAAYGVLGVTMASSPCRAS